MHLNAQGGESNGRVEEIDGIRGWAALSVVIFHQWLETFGKIHPEFVKPVYYFFVDGPLAVYIFFILSGDALSTPFLTKKSKKILNKMAAKRYFRLSFPISLITATSLAAMWLGITCNVTAANFVHREDWLGSFLNFDPSLSNAFRYAFLSVFTGGATGSNFNTFLWTMPIELIGSILVFLYLYIQSSIKFPMAATAAIIAFLFAFNHWYALFFIGVLLAQLRANGNLGRIRQRKTVKIAGPALVLSAYALEFYLRQTPPVHTSGSIANGLRVAIQDNEKFVIATLFVVGVSISKDLCSLFKTRLSIFLGQVSFPIYLVQQLILCTVTSRLIISFNHALNNKFTCIAISAFSISITLIAGYAFSYAEKYSLRLADRAAVSILATGKRVLPM